MYANTVQWLLPAGHGNFTMQQATLLAMVRGNIGVFVFSNGKLGQQGIAMMPGRIDGILAVCVIAPDRISKKLYLPVQRPGAEPTTVLDMLITHFLQKNDVCLQLADQLTLLMQGKACIETCHTFMDIKGGNTQDVLQA